MITPDTRPQVSNWFDKTANTIVRIASINTHGVQRTSAYMKYDAEHPAPNFIQRMFNSTSLGAFDNKNHTFISRFELTHKN